MPKNKAAPSDHAAKLQNYVLGDLLAAPSKSGCCSDCPPSSEEAKADEVCQENCQDDTEDSDDKDKDKKHDAVGAADLEKVTDYAEDKEIVSTGVELLVAYLDKSYK